MTAKKKPVPRTRLRTPYNYSLGDGIYDTEQDFGKSVTVPDMTLSLKDLVSRAQRGLPVPGRKDGSYNDFETPDLERLDLAELEDLALDNKAYIADLEAENLKIHNELEAERQRLAEIQKRKDEKLQQLLDEEDSSS